MTTYGLVGKRLGHSQSAAFFAKKFANEHISARYLNFELPDISLLPDLLRSYPEIEGLNVTIPYKQAVLPYLTRTDDMARVIGAVNTIKIDRTDEGVCLYGYNTDAPGFMAGLLHVNDCIPEKALILGGTGGAAAAVIYALNSHGVSTTIVSRRPAADQLTYYDLTEDVIRTHGLIVNCTPLGTYPNVDTLPDIPYQYITARHIAYDLVYNPTETAFLRCAKAQGALTINGLHMLHAQALLAYRLWTQ